jgi:predicted small integral membrane protein
MIEERLICILIEFHYVVFCYICMIALLIGMNLSLYSFAKTKCVFCNFFTKP